MKFKKDRAGVVYLGNDSKTHNTLLMIANIQERKEKRYKVYDQDQVVNLPILLFELVKENALSQIINEIVEGIAQESLDTYYSISGRPPYHPRMMIKVWLYGFCNKIYTSRKLAKKLREDLVFMWLSGMQKPCFKTLSDFRGNRMKGLIEVVFKQMLYYLVEHNYIDLEDLYVDGSKWEANANKHKITWKKNTYRYKERVLQRIEELLKEVGELQEREDAEYGNKDLKEKRELGEIHLVLNSESLTAQIKSVNDLVEGETDKKRKRKLKSIKGKLQKEQTKLEKYEHQEAVLGTRNSYSHTDEDATGLRMKDDLLKPGYNVQITSSNQFIVNGSIHSNASDSPTLIPHIEQLEERIESLVDSNWDAALTTDAGYGSEENYEYLKEKGIEGYVKFPMWYQEHSGKLAKQKYRRENWFYNEVEDYFLCPNQKHFYLREQVEKQTKNGYSRKIRIYESEGCAGCPFFEDCRGENASPDSNRTIWLSRKLEAHKEKARELLSSEKGIEKRSRRGVEVETPFGDIKYNMGHRRFILRGKEKVHIEFMMLAISHNLRKVYCDKTGIWKEYYAQRAAKRAQKRKKRA